MNTKTAIRTLQNEATTDNANGAGATPAPGPKASPLDVIREEFKKAGKPVDMKAAKSCKAELVAAAKAVADAEAAVEKSKTALYTVSAKLMAITGAIPVTIDGVLFNPASRGEKVFYRPAGSATTISL